MTSTPERRDSTGSVSSLHSTKNQNLVFGSTRRYSRAYEQPVVQNTLKGPSVRVEMEDGRSIDLSQSRTTDGRGKVLNPEATVLANLVAKVSIGALSLVAILISLVSKTTLLATSQLFGFLFMFSGTFLVGSGLYLWWSTLNKESVPLTIKTIPYLYLLCALSSILSLALSWYMSFPLSSTFPQEASYYVFFVTMLFIVFSLLVHRDNLNGMFSQETCVFVGLTAVLDFVAMCLFADILPALIYTQLPLSSMLMGTTLSLVWGMFPNLTPSAVYKVLTQSLHHRGPGVSTSPHPGVGGRSKRTSDISMESSIFPRNSVSSYSSYSFASKQPSHETELITEAHGLISDLLLTKDSLNNDAQTKLKKVVELLNPRVDKGNSPSRRIHVGDHIGYDHHDYEDDVHTPMSDISSTAAPSSTGTGQSSNRLSVAGKMPHKHRNSAYQRQSVSTFAVATSASGMPVLDSEPVDRKRSIALREVRARISVQEKKHSVHKMSRERLGSLEKLSKPSTPTHKGSHSPLTFTRSSSARSDTELSEGEGNKTGEDRPSVDVATPPDTPSWRVTSHDSGPSTLDVISEENDPRPRSNTAPNIIIPSPLSGQVEREDDSDSSQPKFWVGRGGKESRPASGYTVFNEFVQPPEFQISQYSESGLPVLEQVGAWDFPIFELEEKAGEHVLSQMAYVLFQESGLMETFKIPQREFINFFRALEANYGSNVYHNKTHAADVLHGVSYLLFEMIPGFTHAFSGGNEREWKVPSHGKGLGGNIASAFSILEVFACYMAAAMHDFDHPGRTNAFLVATKSPLAILYNDRSVLENHHAAASWDLLTCVPGHNFLDTLDEAELKRFRFLVVEAILATDLKMHFEILANFKTKTHPEEGEGIDWMSEVDRLMVIKIIIKMADINTPTKSYDLHRAWTERITEEFYQQAEEETNLGLPPTIFMDRRHPEKLPAIQLSFIQHLVSPLFQAAATAGIIPGILDTTGSLSPEPEQDELEESSDHKEEGLDLGDDAFSIRSPQQKFMSILLTNLDVNYDGWRAELPLEEKAEEEKNKENVDGDSEEEGDDNTPTAKTSDTSIPVIASNGK